MKTVDISGLDRAEVLAALNNNALVHGLKVPHKFQMTVEEAREYIASGHSIDWIDLKALKLFHGLRDGSSDQLDVTMYERENGSAEPIISRLRKPGGTTRCSRLRLKAGETVSSRPSDPFLFTVVFTLE